MTSLPYFQPCAGVNLMIKGGVAHGWLMDTSHEFQLLHRYKPAFCNPMPFEVGEPISHLFRDSLNQVAHLGSAQKQCMSNACKYFTFFLPWNVLRRLQILCSFCAMPNAITLIIKTMIVCPGNIFLKSYF